LAKDIRKPAPPNANKNLATESPGTVLAPQLLGDSVWPAAVLGNSIVANSVLGDSVAKSASPSLFDAGYCDVMEKKLESVPNISLTRRRKKQFLYYV